MLTLEEIKEGTYYEELIGEDKWKPGIYYPFLGIDETDPKWGEETLKTIKKDYERNFKEKLEKGIIRIPTSYNMFDRNNLYREVSLLGKRATYWDEDKKEWIKTDKVTEDLINTLKEKNDGNLLTVLLPENKPESKEEESKTILPLKEYFPKEYESEKDNRNRSQRRKIFQRRSSSKPVKRRTSTGQPIFHIYRVIVNFSGEKGQGEEFQVKAVSKERALKKIKSRVNCEYYLFGLPDEIKAVYKPLPKTNKFKKRNIKFKPHGKRYKRRLRKQKYLAG